ncbi:MAG: folate hydrolase, partial [Acidobacteria bacterium]
FTDFADTMHKYVDELQKLLKDKQEKISEQNKELEEGLFSATADPKEKSVPPSMEEVPPHLAFAALQNASDALTRSADHYQKGLDKLTKDGSLVLNGAVSIEAINTKLLQSERKLTSADGLPGRPWFKHMVYAPGYYTGYGVKTIPGVREAIEQKKWKEADEQIARIAQVLQDEAVLIDSAAGELEGAQK